MPRQIDLKEAKQKIARFCAFRERSLKEVRDKLTSWNLDPSEVPKVVKQLNDEGFVDEQRFANAFCHDKFEFNSWGKQKIRQYIFIHQLDKQVVENALNRIDPKKYEKRLAELARKKWDSLEKEEPLNRKKKTVAYLANKGFEMDLIWECLNSIKSPPLDSDAE